MLHSMAHTYLGPDAMNSDNFTDMIPGMIDASQFKLFNCINWYLFSLLIHFSRSIPLSHLKLVLTICWSYIRK